MNLDVAFFSNQFASASGHGIARYARELFRSLQTKNEELTVTPVAAWSSLGKQALLNLQQKTGLEILPLGQKLTPLAWTFLNTPPIERLLSTNVDIVHAVAMGYPVATRKPLVVTVHDIGPLVHPEYFTNTQPWIMRRSLAQTVNQASTIICVSESTADELISYTGSDLSSRIRVIPEGVSSEFFAAPDLTCLSGLKNLPPTGTPFIMSTGKISPRKNILGLIRALSALDDKIPHHLVLVGGNGWKMDKVHQLLTDLKIEDRVHFPGYVSDEQLRALYSLAKIYVHPSLYEGFGLTILEAMAAGCPVITSNTSSLPEVAGDAAILIDPASLAELTNAIELVCTDTAIARELASNSVHRAKQFCWKKCAHQVYDIYRSL